MIIYRWVWRKVRCRRVVRKKGARADYEKHKENARVLVKQKLEHFNQFYKLKYNRVAIKNHSSRWGSCSKKGNLNFNYKLVLLPERLLDYVVVHELCHLAEFNHGPNFWRLVAQTVPDYVTRRKELKSI